MDRNLVKYVEDQRKKGVSAENLAFKLENAGWALEDVDKVLGAVYYAKNSVNNVKLIIVGFIVFVLVLIMLYFVLTNAPSDPVSDPVETETLTPCSAVVDDFEKHYCYVALVEDGYECSSIDDETESTFCYRALEEVLVN